MYINVVISNFLSGYYSDIMEVAQERRQFTKNMKTIKEEFIQLESDEDDRLTISEFSLRQSLIEEGEALKSKKEQFLHAGKRPLNPTYKTKKVNETYDNPLNFVRARNYGSYDHIKAKYSVMRLAEEVQAKSSVMERAKEVQANLAAEFPSFVKLMLHSNVINGFQLTIPRQFCNLNIPEHDTTIILVDESGKEYRTNFLPERRSLSGGWKKYSEDHKLLADDALVFHLVKPSKFKVYIVRANYLGEVDGALGLLSLDVHAKQTGGNRHSRPLPLDIHWDNVRRRSILSSSSIRPEENQTGDEGFGSNNAEHIKSLSKIAASFNPLPSFEKFSIVVNGFAIDSELSEQLRTKYYDLCCSQRSNLHDHLLKNIDVKLAAEIISKTINIADAIKTCNLSTPRGSYVAWDKTLSAFELLGMNVRFLRARVNQLQNLAFESKGSMESKRYEEAKFERAHAKKKMRILESKLSELEARAQKLGDEIEDLKVNAERHKLMFEEEVNAPW